MDLSLKPSHLRRYQALASLLVKYKRSGLAAAAAAESPNDREPPDPEFAKAAAELTHDLERMGPTFIKLGQLLSTRADFLPPAALDALARLQDDVEPFSFADVERIVAEELGVRISKAFADFDPRPLAAASLGQVHRATLRDGRPVVVKVQRPNIRDRVAEDLEAFEEVAAVLDKRTKAGERYRFGAMMEEFRKSLLAELDYRLEAQNLSSLADNLAQFDRIVVPRPIMDYTTHRVLTMEYVQGVKVTDLSPVALVELNGAELAEQLFHAYLTQVFVDGFFHADPHPGNVFITADGRIALIDLGMVSRIAPRLQEHLLQLTIAVGEGRSDEAADVALKISDQDPSFDERTFRRRVADVVARHRDSVVEDIQVGKAFLDMARTAGESGIHPPPEFTMLGKALLNLDTIGRTIAPSFDPNASVRRNSTHILNRRLLKTLSPANVSNTVLETKDLITRLPARVNRILDEIADGQIGVKVDMGIDPEHIMQGLQKVANRVATGLVLAALIVGAAMMMRIPTSFTIFGYPGLAMIMFLAAAAGAFSLALVTLRDVHGRPRVGTHKRNGAG
jgi:predicted unusual protein kinase regulating ubiquinone biosynthesis (AarF/ABC1/UbiB family)